MQRHSRKFGVSLAVCLLLAGCSGRVMEQTANDISILPTEEETGIEVMVAYEGGEERLKSERCLQNGKYVHVDGLSGSEVYPLNEEGVPCNSGHSEEEIFNGASKLSKRPNIDSRTRIGEPSGEKAPDVVEVEKEISKTLEGEIQRWEQENKRKSVYKEAERLLADYRDYSRMSTEDLLKVQQEEIERLHAELRGKEKEVISTKEFRKKLVGQTQRSQEIASAEKLARLQREEQLQKELKEIEQKAVGMEEANKRLLAKAQEEKARYERRLATARSNVREAEGDAILSRQQLVLEAARKIAEAERLAKEARMARAEARKRQAERLMLEAEEMARQSHSIGGIKTQIGMPAGGKQEEDAPVAANITPRVFETSPLSNEAAKVLGVGTLPMEEAEIIVRAENMPLKDVFIQALGSLEPQAGVWDVVWKVSEKNERIAMENWTVIAETTFGEFLDYVKKQVKKNYGIKLKYHRFAENSIIVISD